ncbi:MAG TPA: molecular chaperone DnaK [Alphaproteobacteria bacterium]|nr:molecular chaperone DnaK [Alphaproteobacteria bacterium]
MAKIIGIDLGTSNSAAAVLEGGKPRIVPSAEGATMYGKAFPSVVAFTKTGELLVGEPARRQAVSNPEGTIMAAKRKMGTDHKFKVHGKEYTPQQISAFILQKIKKDAEAFLGDKVEKAVITVPAYFDDNQRQATKDAGTIAGLEVIRIINEPTAAALSYGLDKEHAHKVMVFDLGGGTLDVTIMEFDDGVFEVKSTSGDTQLGGTDMDNLLVDYVVKEFKKTEGIDISKDKVAMQRVREAVEKAKIELSTVIDTEINLPFLTADQNGPKHFTHKLTRAKLEQIIEPIIKRCKHPIEQAINDAKLSYKDIEKIIMVGGPTRIPMVQKFVEDVTGRKVERGVDPMECVALGASIQAGVLAGEVKDVLLLDVTPLSLGIETLGGVTTKLIERNTTIPTKKSQIFSTAVDNQNAVTIHVLQGERPMATDNKSLGRFDLMGIPPAPRGIPQIEVSFDIDANGIVHVGAKDLGTGKEQSIKITAAQKLDNAEIERMKKEAEAHAEDDKKRMEEIALVNEADALVYSSERLFDEMKGKVSESKIEEAKKEVNELKDLLPGKDLGAIKAKLEVANKKVQELSMELYQKVAEEQQKKQGGHSHGAEAEAPADDNVVDAEFEDKSDDDSSKKKHKKK